MKKSKKLIAMLLTLMMLLSILPVAAFAADPVPAELQGTWCGTSTEGADGTLVIGEKSCTLSVEGFGSKEYSYSSKYNNYAFFNCDDESGDELSITFGRDDGTIYVQALINTYMFDFNSMARQGGPYTPPHTHSLTEVKTCSATCTTDGVKTAYYVCTGDNGCGKYFSDSEGKNEISKATVESYTIPAAHTYGGATYAWNGDSCTATLTCSACTEGTDGHSISEIKQGSYVKDTDATCLAAETGHYAVTFTDTQFGSAQTDSFTNGEPVDHSYTGEVKDNGDGTHSFKCVNGCNEYGGTVACSDGNADHKCDICDAVLSECKDENSDHFCDYEGCGDKLSECIDENSDHFCDYEGCGDKLSECVDENSDHYCDFAGCGDKLSECVDENNDHYCDFEGCGEKISDCKDENSDGYCDICGANLDPLAQDRADAIATLEAIVGDNTNEKVLAMLADYVDQINNASSLNEINRIVSNATSALKNQIEIANEGSFIGMIRAFVNLCDNNHQKTTNKVMGIIKPILGLFGIK